MPDLLDRLKAALADRYAIEREIGAGDMATVCVAENRNRERWVPPTIPKQVGQGVLSPTGQAHVRQLLTLLLFILAGCGGTDSPTDPDQQVTGPLVVTPDSVTLSTMGSTVPVTVTVGGTPVNATFTLRSEVRWIHTQGVLEDLQLEEGSIVARAPGRAVVNVATQGQTDSIIVNVVPTRPLVLEIVPPGGQRHVGDGDTIQLRGYQMDQVTADNVVVPGATVQLGISDSANVGVIIPTAAAGLCKGSAAISFQFSGIDGSGGGDLTRKRVGEVALGVGEAKRLTDTEAACIRLAPANGSRYLLAYADTRLTTKAQTTTERPYPDSIVVTAADHSVPSTARQSTAVTPPAHVLPGPDLHDRLWRLSDVDAMATATTQFARVPAGCPFIDHFIAFCRATPWTNGEAFTYYPAARSDPPTGQARVIALRGNLVLAVFLPDSSRLALGIAERADSMLQFMADRGATLYRNTFGLAGFSTTTDESGQLLLMLEDVDHGGSFANWWPDPTGGGHGRWAKVSLGLAGQWTHGSSAAQVLPIVAHELFHTYQYRWRFEAAEPWRGTLGTFWAVEGGATFANIELSREFANVPFLSNYQLPVSVPDDDPFRFYLRHGGALRLGDFLSRGGVASFMRDLVQRLVLDGGLSFDDAVREVEVGAMEGWWGINAEDQRLGSGLTTRMRAWLGESWNPTDALLDWTMSTAADDLTSNPKYQNLTIRQVMPSTGSNRIRPHGLLTDGLSVTVRRQSGNTGVFELEDRSGGSYVASATVAGTASDALEWLLLRIN